MPSHQSACQESQLWALLDAPEDSAEFQTLAAHVEHCPGCQKKLGELAAQKNDWCEIPRLLVPDDLDNEVENDFSEPRFRNDQEFSQAGVLDAIARQLLEPPGHPEMLGRLGRYEVERLIGSGGMGIVFKAFDTELNRPVAIKVLAPHLAGSGAAKKRFAREARAVAAVVHEHVVAIHNVESERDPPFFVMQFVAGESLQDRLNRDGPLELCEILRIGFQTAAGLAAAHAQGLVHRDVKPSNILLEKHVDRALLTDFGLARASDDASLTHSGCLPGTPHYMSPEQARGESVGVESDLFSLGSVLYAMCAGHPPFRAETAYGVLRRITDSQPRSLREQNPHVPEWLERIVFKLLSKKPEERFASAEEAAGLLERCLAHVQQPTTVALPEFCQRPPASRWLRPSLGAAIGLMLLTVTWTIAGPWFSAISQPPSKTAIQEPNQTPPDPSTSTNEPKESQVNPNPLTEWDHAQEQINALKEEAEELEADLSRPW